MTEQRFERLNMTFDQAVEKTRDLLPCGNWLRNADRRRLVGSTLGQMAERLLCTRANISEQFCAQVMCFIYLLADIRSQKFDKLTMKTRLVDIKDFCYGLNADEEAVMFLKEIYRNNSTPLNILAADCVASFKGGLTSAEDMLFQFLKDADERTRLRAASVITGAVRLQEKMAEDAGIRFGWPPEDRLIVLRSIDGFRRKLFHFDMPPDVRARLVESGTVRLFDSPDVLLDRPQYISLDDLLADHVRDGDFFKQRKDILLKDHEGEYVAIRNAKILGFAKNISGLQAKIKQTVGQGDRVFIAIIISESFEDQLPIEIF